MSGPQHILLRCDGGPTIGFGHAMRCLSLGQALLRVGVAVSVVTRDLSADLERRFQDAGIAVERGCTVSSLGAALAPAAISAVFDGYTLGDEVAEAAGLPLIVIDDNLELPVDLADIVVNPNVFAAPQLYSGRTSATLLLGPSFAMLREEVVALARRRDEDERVLVSFGGADPLRLTAPVVERLAAAGVPLVVAVQSTHPDRDVVRRLARRHVHVELDAGDLVGALGSATMAVVAAGTTLYELAYLGVPTVAVATVDNQLPGCAAAVHAGMVATAPVDPDGLAAAVLELRGDDRRREELTTRCLSLVDGAGAARVARVVTELAGAATSY